MAKRKPKKKTKDIDINIKINDIERFIHKCKKWNHKREKERWQHHGIGFWGFGSSLAIVLSYTQNSSILWAIVHGIFSWFYVIYRIIIPYF